MRGLLTACQKLVRIGRPGNREQRQNRNNAQRLHPLMVVLDCGQKRQSLAHFLDKQKKHRGGRQRGDRDRRVADRPLPETTPIR